jgi:4-aminobutyrate---pyruvate transaminase
MNRRTGTNELSTGSKDATYHLHAMTNPRAHRNGDPFVIACGEGIHVIDETGRRFIDGMAGLWCVSLGYSEARLAAAAFAQLQALPYNPTFRGRTHQSVAELSEKLVTLAPGDIAKVFYAHSGSDANDTAVKIAWFYNNALGRPEKRKIISRMGGYHGSTIISASLGGHAYLHTNFNLPLP